MTNRLGSFNMKKSRREESPRSHFERTHDRKRIKRTKRNSPSLLEALQRRELQTLESESVLARTAERISIMGCSDEEARNIELGPGARCTIAVAYSGEDRILSTHGGDHSVKISSFSERKVIKSLEYHQRTPWAIAVHPRNSNIMASGCLNGAVCIWINDKLFSATQCDNHRIIIMSLTFKTSSSGKDLLIISSGNYIYSWEYESDRKPQRCFVRDCKNIQR